MTTWTTNDKVAFLLKLPWTILAEEGDEPGDIVLSIGEIPAAIGTGRTASEVEADLYESLAAVIRVYVSDGDRPPLPKRVLSPLPWESASHEHVHARIRAVMKSGQVSTIEGSRARTSRDVLSTERELEPA